MCRCQDHVVGRGIKQRRRKVLDLTQQYGPTSVVLKLRLGNDDEPLRAAEAVVTAEGHHAAPPYPGQISDRIFEFLRVDVASGADDDVLAAASEKDIPAGNIGEIARLHPSVTDQCGGGSGVAQIAGGG